MGRILLSAALGISVLVFPAAERVAAQGASGSALGGGSAMVAGGGGNIASGQGSWRGGGLGWGGGGWRGNRGNVHGGAGLGWSRPHNGGRDQVRGDGRHGRDRGAFYQGRGWTGGGLYAGGGTGWRDQGSDEWASWDDEAHSESPRPQGYRTGWRNPCRSFRWDGWSWRC